MSVGIAVTALPCGLLIGLLLGALGGGGSVLAVPVLVYLLGQSPHEATAGALVVVAVGCVTGLACHARAGRIRWAAGAVFGALGTAGTYLGSRWSAALDPALLMSGFALLMLTVAVLMVVRTVRERRARPDGQPEDVADVPLCRAEPDGIQPDGTHQGGTPSDDARPDHAQPVQPDRERPDGARPPNGPADPGEPDRKPDHQKPAPALPPRSRPVRIAATATAVGLLTGFFGVGGGFVVVPALTLVLGLEMPVAIGTSLLVILINSGTALATRAGTGALDWPLLAGFAACAALGSYLGNRLTTRLPPQLLTTAFASLVTLLAVTMAAAALPHL
ncbi:TSUP family transporter [Streptomyces celluloflavus]|uniref:sulfite exporter TauE/SafE family protein n=1 Tax=Streptomyces celluloflavus TaxID=58344 RepID=UPI0036DE4368